MAEATVHGRAAATVHGGTDPDQRTWIAAVRWSSLQCMVVARLKSQTMAARRMGLIWVCFGARVRMPELVMVVGSVDRKWRGYEQLGNNGDKPSPSAALVPKLSRSKSLPTKMVNPPKMPQEAKKPSKIHPFFSIFESRRRKKATAKPEFSRYLDYLREGGEWDMATDRPVMYYK
ncbi:hypothetical protein SASPL_145181 [Salvia splendens]|uniref:Uncharacterized protein n=1 Tax=Salvia splendens TaxID=180675 RepID=A0A8X8Z7X2_SALSN|nr:hypothetical protein SASPL_145181 [Salvia splendens]